MILQSNLKVLREKFNINYLFNNEANIYVEEKTKNKENTIYFLDDNNRKQYLHSKYDPYREIQNIANSYEGIENKKAIIFFGLGLGYLFEEILLKNKNARVYIIEPKKEIFDLFIKTVPLSSYIDRIYGMNINNYNIGSDLSRFIDINNSDVEIIALPSYKNNFNNEYEDFTKELVALIKNKKDSLIVNRSFQNRWIINSIKNFNYVLNSQNILSQKINVFDTKTVILVSAGPSLDFEIDNLKYIKKNKLAYIIAVGSSINALLYNDIYPDFVITYDPWIYNSTHFKKIKDEKIKDIGIIFGSSVAYDVIEDYPGKMIHFITEQDTISNYLLKEDLKSNRVVEDAPTIAAIGINIFSKLKVKNIVLVGQNLAYLDNKKHAKGRDKKETKIKNEGDINILDVNGENIKTTESYVSMKEAIEYYISNNDDIMFYNTTKYGVDIKGAKYVELKEIIDSRLKEIDIDNSIISKKYDVLDLDKNRRKLYREYKDINIINKNYKKRIEQIEKALKIKEFNKLEKLYVQLDKELRKIENNDFYKVIILPMVRVEYKLLTDNIDNLNDIINPIDKANKIIKEFKKFIEICIEKISEVEELYINMDKKTEKFYNKETENVK